MNKIFRLAMANIRKTKGHTLSLLTMFLISAVLLNAGLLVNINFGNFFEKTTKELNTSDIYYIMSSQLYNEEVDYYFNHNGNFIEKHKEESIWAYVVTKYNKETREQGFLINDASVERNMSKWKFVGKHLTPDEMSIYLPYLYKKTGGYKLNDTFEMTLDNKKFTFTVKGFTEDVLFSSTETGLLSIYMPHDTFEYVSNELDDKYNATIIFANAEHINKDAETEIRELTNAKIFFNSTDLTSTLFSLDLQLVKLSRVMMATMVAVMIVAFSLIIVGVCLIVIRFRIGNSIEDDMTKIGSLKAMGYTSKQIILSIVLQFFLIAFFGSIIGIFLSYLSIPALSDVFAQQSGFKWEQGFDIVISSISLGIIVFIVVVVAFITSRRINKLNPIVALRGGLITHSFRKNHLPLNTSKGSLPVVLALKSVLQNIKQTMMIVIILITVAFAGTFSVVMFYNTTIDTRTFAETPGVEISNVAAIFKPETDITVLSQNIKNMNDVRKVQFIDEVMVKVDKNEVIAFVMEDYSKKETNTIYEGRYPKHSNEVAISGPIARLIDKNIGDSITLKVGENESEFIITGLTQGAYMLGLSINITQDGIRKLNPNFKEQNLQIYLDKGVKSGEFIEELNSLYGDEFISVIDVDKNMAQGMSAYTSIVSKVGIAILIVTISVVILVLYFVINSTVIRKKRELGIQKAVGFTTFQLMNQISLGFLLPIIIGVVIGCILGITQMNALMSISQRSMGIMKANYIITPNWIALLGFSIIIVSYMTSMILTYRIRNISAYDLVSE